MEEFGVEIRFPRNEGADPNMITVLGKDEGAVFDCIDRLRSIEEDVIQEQQDKVARERPRKTISREKRYIIYRG